MTATVEYLRTLHPLDSPEPTYRCRCGHMHGWVEVAAADHATTTVKPCSACNGAGHERWAGGKWMPR